jgi:hypothetical protein
MGTGWSIVLWAGFAATVLSACVFWLFRTLKLTQWSPTLQLGALFYDDPRLPLTETVGLALFMALGTTVVAGAYAALMAALGGAGWGSGLLLGVLHGGATAAAAPWLGRVNRVVSAGRLPRPGRFGMAWGRWTPAAVMAGHAAYGAVLGGILGAA